MSNELQPEVAADGADASLEPNWGVVDEPEETEVESEEAEQPEEAKESEAESPPADKEEVDEKPDPFQKRIDELTRRYRSEQRAREELEQKIAELEARKPEPRESAKTLKDFEYDEEAYAAYLFEETEKRAEQAAERYADKLISKRREEEAIARFSDAEREFSKEVKDYVEVVHRDDLAISNTMAAEIRESEIGPEIAYYLGKNPDIALNIAQMSDREAVREMTKLESKLQGEKQKAASKKVSEAPPPPSKIKATEPANKVDPTDPASDKLSDDEWFKREEARLAKRRG